MINRKRFAEALSTTWMLLAVGVSVCAIWFGPLQQPDGMEVVFVLATMVLAFASVLFATGRLVFSMMLVSLIFLLIGVVGHLKQKYLGNAFLASDIYYLTGAHILATIWKYPHLRILMLGLPAVSITLLWTTWQHPWMLFRKNLRLNNIGIRTVGCICFSLLLFWTLTPSGPFTKLYGKSMWVAINENANLTSFLMSFGALKVELPNVHNTPAQNAKWDRLAARIEEKAQAGDPGRPDIVVVLEESTFDPSTLPECNIPQCKNHSLVEPDAWTKAHGPMRSYVYGGGTALSEYDVLTGLPYGIFGLAGGYAPWSLAARMRDSLPIQLRKLGYRTVAVYTVDGGYMNAREAYKDYGFDAFYDAPELGLPAWGATDEQMFKAAERVYAEERKKSDKPVFLMLKTIEQHGPHNNHPLATLPSPYQQGLFPELSPEAQLNLSNYLARMDASDKAMADLEKFFLGRGEPTIVLSFGDHKPNFSGAMSELKITPPQGYDGDPKYLTYFKLDANFETPKLPQFTVTDIAFLPEFILQAGRLPLDKYFSGTEYLRDVCKGLFDKCADKQVLFSYYAWLFSDDEVFE